MIYSDLDILYLMTKKIPDYLHDALYKGFCDLGCNVVDFPEKSSLHGSWCSEEYRVEQLLFDYPKKQLNKTQLDVLIVTGMIKNYNLCNTPEGWAQFIQQTIDKTNPKKIVMIDGEDFAECSYPIVTRDFDLVFKRELFQKPYPNWHSINFCAIPEPFEYVPYSERIYDVSFIATMSNPYRIEIRDFLIKKASELGLHAYIYLEKKPLYRSEFLRIVSQSKACVSVRGMGRDCYRYWELPARGNVMITEDTGLLIENDFTDRHVFKFKNFNDLTAILSKIKYGSIEELEGMALQALLYTQQYHTPRTRARYILDKIYE